MFLKKGLFSKHQLIREGGDINYIRGFLQHRIFLKLWNGQHQKPFATMACIFLSSHEKGTQREVGTYYHVLIKEKREKSQLVAKQQCGPVRHDSPKDCFQGQRYFQRTSMHLTVFYTVFGDEEDPKRLLFV